MASVTLQKAKRILTTDGPISLVRRGFRQFSGFSRAMLAMRTQPVANSNEVEELLDYGLHVGRGVIAPFQVRSEILGLLKRVRDLRPRVVLEIGTANGGTLFLFTRVADPAAHLVSVDLPGGQFGEGYPAWKIPLYHSFALRRQRVSLIRGDSHAPQTLEITRRTLDGAAVDFLFIDGDHSYEGVKKDFEMYSPLVRSGGLIAFHDVAKHQSDNCQVDRFWAELRTCEGAEELIERTDQGWAGIGLLRMRGERK